MAETLFRRYAVLPTPVSAHRLHTDLVLREFPYHVQVAVFQDLDHASAWVSSAG